MSSAFRSLVTAFGRSSKSLYLPSAFALSARRGTSSNINRPAPPSLPKEEQREFENLFRAAQTPLSVPTSKGKAEAELALHPDVRQPLKAEFEGDVNPKTGEEGGPKREPVGKWADSDGDWSFKGRVTDF
jgi:hypothetical protein